MWLSLLKLKLYVVLESVAGTLILASTLTSSSLLVTSEDESKILLKSMLFKTKNRTKTIPILTR